MTAKTIEGKLLLYSETGMEGGNLSIQDRNYITYSSPTFGIANNCKVWGKNDLNRQGITSNAEVLIDNNWFEYPDPIWKDKDFEISTLYRGESHGNKEADKRLSEKFNFKIKYWEERLNETYGKGGWKVDRKLPGVILADGTHLLLGEVPTTMPARPYGIQQGGTTRVTVKWNDGSIQKQVLSDELLIELWDFKGLHFLKDEDILKIIDPGANTILCEGQINQIPLIIFSQTSKGHFDLVNERSFEWETFFAENYFARVITK